MMKDIQMPDKPPGKVSLGVCFKRSRDEGEHPVLAVRASGVRLPIRERDCEDC